MQSDKKELEFFHIGITVQSIESAKKFFIDLLECEVISERELFGGYLSVIFGDETIVSAQIAMLQMKNGPILELVQYGSSSQGNNVNVLNIGTFHLAHFVSDLDSFTNRARILGATTIGPEIGVIPAGPYAGKRIAFLQTKLNVLLEVIELQLT